MAPPSGTIDVWIECGSSTSILFVSVDVAAGSEVTQRHIPDLCRGGIWAAIAPSVLSLVCWSIGIGVAVSTDQRLAAAIPVDNLSIPISSLSAVEVYAFPSLHSVMAVQADSA